MVVQQQEQQTPVFGLGGTTLGGRESDGGAWDGRVVSSLSIDKIDSFIVNVDVDNGVDARGSAVDHSVGARGVDALP